MLDARAALPGRVAVVTGGAGGLGRAITQDLARAGVGVAVCDRNPEAVASLDRDLAAAGRDAFVECLDVRDSDALEGFFTAVDHRFGQLDILVAVPGGSYRQGAIDLVPRGVDALIRENFTSFLESSQHAARRMRARGTGGSIVHVSTIEAYRAMPEMAVYGAMKAAADHLTRTLAVEWGPLGIRVNAVAPDHFEAGYSQRDDRTAEAPPPAADDMVIPLGRRAGPHELSSAVLFLASDLSSYVTGTTLHLDGGTLAAAGWMRFAHGYENIVPGDLLGGGGAEQ